MHTLLGADGARARLREARRDEPRLDALAADDLRLPSSRRGKRPRMVAPAGFRRSEHRSTGRNLRAWTSSVRAERRAERAAEPRDSLDQDAADAPRETPPLTGPRRRAAFAAACAAGSAWTWEHGRRATQ